LKILNLHYKEVHLYLFKTTLKLEVRVNPEISSFICSEVLG